MTLKSYVFDINSEFLYEMWAENLVQAWAKIGQLFGNTITTLVKEEK